MRQPEATSRGAIREARQDRFRRCRGNLRSGDQTHHALRGVKSEEQQAALILHKTRDLLVRQRTMLINALRTHLGEYGIVKAQGPAGVNSLLALMLEAQDGVPADARSALRSIVAQFHPLVRDMEHLKKQILDWHRHDEVSQHLAMVPGIGPITASTIAATVSDASIFRSGHQFAAWLALTPRPHSSGGKERLCGITKRETGTFEDFSL